MLIAFNRAYLQMRLNFDLNEERSERQWGRHLTTSVKMWEPRWKGGKSHIRRANSTKSPTNQCRSLSVGWKAGEASPNFFKPWLCLRSFLGHKWDLINAREPWQGKSWQRVELLKLLMILSNCYGVFQVLQCFLLSEVAPTWAHLNSVHKWCVLPISSFLKATLKPK